MNTRGLVRLARVSRSDTTAQPRTRRASTANVVSDMCHTFPNSGDAPNRGPAPQDYVPPAVSPRHAHRVMCAATVGPSVAQARAGTHERTYATAPAIRSHSTASPGKPQKCNSSGGRSEEHTSELQSQSNLVCRLLLEKKKKKKKKQ